MAKDLTKFRIKGTDKWLPKNRVVLACVKQFFEDVIVKDNNYLQNTWTPETQGSAGIIRPIEDVQNERYYFMDELLTAPDGKQYVVSNQWGSGNFDQFIVLAERLGYPIESNSSKKDDPESINIFIEEISESNEEDVLLNVDKIVAVIKYRKYIEEDFTKNNFFPTFRDLIFSVPPEDRVHFIDALKELTKENAIPYLHVGFSLTLQDWTSEDDELNAFISAITDVIDQYKPSLMEYITHRKDMMFAVANSCISYEIGFETLKNIPTKLFLFGLRASGFEHINELDNDVKIGRFKHSICSVFHHIFSRLDMDDEYQTPVKLCHLLTGTIDDFIEGFPLEHGCLIQCLGQVLWIRYQLNIGSYISDSEVFDFESKDFWGFDFEYPVDFKRLAIDILKIEGYQF